MPSPVEPHRFIEILKPDRCPICFLTGDYAHDHVRNLLEESVTDPDSRDVLFRSRGFCRRHAWKAVAQGQALGMAVIYASLLEKGLKDLGPKPGFFGPKPPDACPICESESDRETVALQQFVLCWNESSDLRTAFSAHGVLCLSHLEKTLSGKVHADRRKDLFETGKKALERLLKELNEFLEKQDYHRSLESIGQERDAWVRAVRMIAGERE
jgi:hypothetical protein